MLGKYKYTPTNPLSDVSNPIGYNPNKLSNINIGSNL